MSVVSDPGSATGDTQDDGRGNGHNASMKPASAFEFPPAEQAALRKARRLAWWTIAYLATVVVSMYLASGSSQAMKTAWLEDMLSLVPPAVFLFASYTSAWPPNKRHP